MLINGDYSYDLKRRILSSRGHLSNTVCADTVTELIQTGTTRIILAHISRNNNTLSLAEETTISKLRTNNMKRNSDYILHIAKPEKNNPKIIY